MSDPVDFCLDCKSPCRSEDEQTITLPECLYVELKFLRSSLENVREERDSAIKAINERIG
jgi:hypothetical protein